MISAFPPIPLPAAAYHATSAFTDTTLLARLDPGPVMAEQISHNVVNERESTSGSPLVDAAANQSTTESAVKGTAQPTKAENTSKDTASDSILHSNISTEHATSANATTAETFVESGAAKDAAEPSAGEAAPKPALTQGDAVISSAEGKGKSTTQGDLVNGVHEDEGHADDNRSTADVSVDMSVNSDTDMSRADMEKKEEGQIRANSVKKPTTFSRVNVTKAFLNKAAPTTTVASGKIGDKPSPSAAAALTAKVGPRLVAKAGSSLQNLQKPRAGPQSAAGPDASKVWNKNRPVQQPPPKQFTDEELKQRYGIHLATRLQADEGGNDNKWADIDDDEDDWAPEAVVWMDGTKSTVAPLEAPAPEQQQQTPQAQPTAQAAAPSAAPSAAPLPPSTSQVETANTPAPGSGPAKSMDAVKPVLTMKRNDSQTMKILKPGAAAIQAKQNGPAGPGTEKPLLKAKSPAPPQKSPWAPVPKPDAVSPIIPPTQMPHAPTPFASQDGRLAPQDGRLAPQDGRVYDSTPPVAAREIAADTFDRSWKEGEGGARELFNSTNGRYEPAPEGRRSSVKQDSAFRKPAVLQRPSHSALTPAEPSAAFQSRTSSQMDGSSWGRRRGSSVSQGSNPAARRMSFARGQDLSQTPEVPFDAGSQASSGPVKPQFPQQSAWDQQMPARPASDVATGVVPMGEPALSVEDQIKAQERVMKEKRELAKKRRQEEEQAEQAAKQERLRAKLASLEGAGKSKKERDAEAAAAATAASKTTPASEQAVAAALSGDKTAPQAQSQPGPAQSLPASTPTAPQADQSRVPTAEKVMPAEDRSQGPFPPKQSPVGQQDTTDASSRQPARAHLSPAAGNRAPYQQSGANFKAPTSSYSSPGDRKPQSFGRSPNNLNTGEFTPWPTTAPNSNVWGTAGIGNGTFESSGVFAPLPMNQQSSSLPPPPGMGRPPTASRISPQGYAQDTRSPNMHQQQMVEQQRGFAPPGMDQRTDPFNQARHAGVAPPSGLGRPSHPPGPIGPPSRTQQQPIARSEAAASWGNVARQLPSAYSAEAAAAAEVRRRDLTAVAPPSENKFQETFKKTSAEQGKLGAPRKYEPAEIIIHGAGGSGGITTTSPAPPTAQTQPPAAFSGASPALDARNGQNVGSTVKIPDFSQNPAHGGTAARQAPIGRPQQYSAPTSYYNQARFPTAPLAPAIESKEQSPPPPETEDHPVNDGTDTIHPHVRLPRPQVKVRLPPLSPSSQQNAQLHPGSPQQPGSAWGPAVPASRAARPIVMDKAWQARFNGLFNRTGISTETPPSPPKTPPRMALAPASLSRAPYDDAAASAMVSLPQAQRIPSYGGRITAPVVQDMATKPTIDRMFNEELSFGSMPKVKIPRNNIAYDLSPQPGHKHILKLVGSNAKFMKPVQPTSALGIFFEKSNEFRLSIPGTQLKDKRVYRPKSEHSYRKASGALGPQQERKPSGKFNKHGKGKDGAENVAASIVGGSGEGNAGFKKPAVENEGVLPERRKSGWTGARGGRGGARGGGHVIAHAAPVAAAAQTA
ncbi:unnamed protein product [Zymoseptoria tritici ST99CH_3D1]|nr:unnamed protein product [Zymoseptoria tritici ST99CH_3D1]